MSALGDRIRIRRLQHIQFARSRTLCDGLHAPRRQCERSRRRHRRSREDIVGVAQAAGSSQRRATDGELPKGGSKVMRLEHMEV